MPNPVIASILSRIGDPDLLGRLDALPSSEFNSLLLEVMRRRSEKITASDLMKAYEQNRFVTPSSVDPLSFLNEELDLLRLATSHQFSPLELSPLAPLGNCSGIALADQNKIVSALRGTEVVADATNLMALESSVRRKASSFDSSIVRLCAVHRHVRAQSIEVKGFTPHFKIFCALTAGRDEGNRSFEKAALLSHLQFYRSYFVDSLKFNRVVITIKGLSDNGDAPVSRTLFDHVSREIKGVELLFKTVPAQEHRYYQHTRFSLDIDHNGRSINVGDGGFVDWGQKLTSNAKERMFTSGIGLELLIKLKSGII